MSPVHLCNPALEKPDPANIAFRPLETADLPLVERWIARPHVLRWWAASAQSTEEIAAKYGARISGQEPTRAYIILYGAIPIGYIQSYLLKDYPEYEKALGVEENGAGIDLFIGEPEYAYRGLGAPLIRQFLREIVFPQTGAISCILGPSVLNTSAIRAYERAGFQYLRTVQVPGEPHAEYVMRITRDDL